LSTAIRCDRPGTHARERSDRDDDREHQHAELAGAPFAHQRAHASASAFILSIPESICSTRPQRAATARSCVTSTSVVCDCELRSNSSAMMRSPVWVSRFPWARRRTAPRARHEGTRNRHALLLTARELARVMAGAVFEPHPVESFPCRIARVAAARELQRQHHVLERCQRGHQVERLEHEAHALGAQARAAIFVQRGQVGAREGNASGSRRIEAGQERQKSRFSGPRSANDGN
jgi:hypothetical protein